MSDDPKPARPRQLETPIHLAILDFLRATLWPGSLVHHSPNEFSASDDTGDIAKAVAKAAKMGRLNGWPDLEAIAAPKLGNGSGQGVLFFVEVKSEYGELSAFQAAIRKQMTALNVPYCVARSTRDVEEFLEWEGIPSRIRKAT